MSERQKTFSSREWTVEERGGKGRKERKKKNNEKRTSEQGMTKSVVVVEAIAKKYQRT